MDYILRDAFFFLLTDTLMADDLQDDILVMPELVIEFTDQHSNATNIVGTKMLAWCRDEDSCRQVCMLADLDILLYVRSCSIHVYMCANITFV